jgi:hypothetical protein
LCTRLHAEVSVNDGSTTNQPQESNSTAAVDLSKRRQQRRLRRRALQLEQQPKESDADVESGDLPDADEAEEIDERAAAGRTRRSRVRSRMAARRKIPAPLTADSSARAADSYGVRIGMGSDDEVEDVDTFNDLDGLVVEAEQKQEQEQADDDNETNDDVSVPLEAPDDDEDETFDADDEERLPSSVLNVSKYIAKRREQKHTEPFDPMELYESNSMYVPVLTDEDLAADPPGHRSGYVAVIGRPNAGEGSDTSDTGACSEVCGLVRTMSNSDPLNTACCLQLPQG